MTIFDTTMIMHDMPDMGIRSVNETIGTLDAELWRVGIAHAFALPYSAEPTDDGKFPVACMWYCEEDKLELSLIYMRWALKERGIQPSKIAKCMVELGAKYLDGEGHTS
jgi:hypothetical protein